MATKGLGDPRKYDYDWSALREEWVSRRMSGEPVSSSQFWREVGERRAADGKKSISLRSWYKATNTWQSALHERQALSDSAMAESMAVDHMQQRREILSLAPKVRDLLVKALRIYRDDLEAQLALPPDQRRGVELSDLKLLAELEVHVRRVGSGLPQVHEVTGTVRHDVTDSRPEALALAEKGREFREHLRRRGHDIPEPGALN